MNIPTNPSPNTSPSDSPARDPIGRTKRLIAQSPIALAVSQIVPEKALTTLCAATGVKRKHPTASAAASDHRHCPRHSSGSSRSTAGSANAAISSEKTLSTR